ncbi:LysR substrate-binding domain-containing protein [Microbacterium gallinarum]|uniref:Transcriptional regulator n=1 Tax=Microbacterium gallinarum TaxID=2762209 RepID=A0ABR8X5S4_9MICO|nr:LysR substrate-binding domain-containing protein [Microbacterium gallinarum]MBD8024679.1 transcriptional regulator [Microbacterium gallinarum]
MARSGKSHARPGKSGRDASPRRSGKGGKPAASSGKGGASGGKGGRPPRRQPAAAATPEVSAAPFRLGAIPGATPGKWISAWRDRVPGVELELVPLEVSDQRRALVDGEVDAALVRLPIDRDDLHAIALYEEIPVVVMAADSHLTAADELDLEDLAGEVVIAARDDVLGIRVPDAVEPAFAPPADTAEAIATVAAGVGVVVVPMSLARLHHRKDVEHRPLRDGPTSTVALCWVADRTTPAVETFVGIVRGRTAHSSRG